VSVYLKSILHLQYLSVNTLVTLKTHQVTWICFCYFH